MGDIPAWIGCDGVLLGVAGALLLQILQSLAFQPSGGEFVSPQRRKAEQNATRSTVLDTVYLVQLFRTSVSDASHLIHHKFQVSSPASLGLGDASDMPASYTGKKIRMMRTKRNSSSAVTVRALNRSVLVCLSLTCFVEGNCGLPYSLK